MALTKEELRQRMDENSEGGGFTPIPDGCYALKVNNIKNIKRWADGEPTKAMIEFEIAGLVVLDKDGKSDGVLYETDLIGRRIWYKNVALDTAGMKKFIIPMANALANRYDDNFDALSAVPYVDWENVDVTHVPGDDDDNWKQYIQYIADCGMTFIATTKHNGQDKGGFDRYYIDPIKDQTAM